MESRTVISNSARIARRAEETKCRLTRSARRALISRLLYIARGVRGLGDGFAIIILPAYLSAIGFSSGQIGLILSASLLGTALLTLAVGFIAPRHDLRNLPAWLARC